MIKMRRTLAILLALTMLAALLAACSQQTNAGSNNSSDGQTVSVENFPDTSDNPDVTVYASEPPSGFSETAVPDTLTVAQGGEPKTLYPLDGNQLPVGIAIRPLYETLINYNYFTMEYEGALAESWEMVDDMTIRIHLREGVTCHAGYEMTANDVLWTAQQGVENPVSAYLWSVFDVDNFEVVDTYTIDMRTYEPFGPLLAYLSDTSVAFIINQQAYEEQSPEDYARNPTGGSGPYKFVEWIAGDRIIYERNEDYWGDKPYFKNLVIRNISDDVTRALSLESGEVDMIYGDDSVSYQTLIDSPTANIVEGPSTQLIHLGLNNAIAPFDDPQVRKAIRYALDLDSMVELAFSGQAEVADACWANGLPAYEEAEGDEKYEYNPEKAKALLAEAGYADGFSFDLWVADTMAWMQMAEMIQNALGDIGLTVNVQTMDQNTLLAQRAEGTYQAYIARFSSSSYETDWWYTRLYSQLSYEQNCCQYNNPRVDELLTEARYSLDDEYRMECYKEILSLWRQDLPWISLACPNMIYGIRSTLTGIEPHPYGCGDLRYIRPINAA